MQKREGENEREKMIRKKRKTEVKSEMQKRVRKARERGAEKEEGKRGEKRIKGMYVEKGLKASKSINKKNGIEGGGKETETKRRKKEKKVNKKVQKGGHGCYTLFFVLIRHIPL